MGKIILIIQSGKRIMCCKVFFFLKRHMFLRIINQIQEKTYIFILFIKQFSVFDIEIIRFVVNNGLTTPFKGGRIVGVMFFYPALYILRDPGKGIQ